MLTRLLLQFVGLPALEFQTRSKFWSTYRRAIALNRGPELLRRQSRDVRLASLLNTAQKTPYFRERLIKAGLDETLLQPVDAMRFLSSLAPIGKSQLRSRFPDGVVVPDSDDNLSYFSTSGTTSARLTIVSDFAKRDANRAAGLENFEVASGQPFGVSSVEIPPNACNTVCGLGKSKPESLSGYLWYSMREGELFSRESVQELRGRLERRLLHSQNVLAPLDPGPYEQVETVLDDRLNAIRQRSPKMLRAFPQYLLWLADRAKNRGMNFPSIRFVSPYGGLASPKMIERITEGFCSPFRNQYGTSELGPVAASCNSELAMHVFENHFLVELFRGDKQALPGEIGEIVMTDLRNLVMPLIRYRVGDVGRWVLEPCSCGRSSPRLEVLGRIQETLILDSGRWITAAEIADIAYEDPGIANVRVDEISRKRFEISVVGGDPAIPIDLNRLQERFVNLIGSVKSVRCRMASFLQPESSGKYRICNPFTPQRETVLE